MGESKVNVVTAVPVFASTLTSDGSKTFLPKGKSFLPGYPFTTFLTSTQTGKVLSLAAKYRSNFVRKQPPVSLTINVCARGSGFLKVTLLTSLLVILVDSLTVS